MALTIRRPMVMDSEEVASLSRAIADRYHVENADEWRKACEHQDECKREEHKRYLVAAHNHASGIIGYACIRPDIPRQPGLGKFRLQLGVQPEWRNQGIGQRLLDAISNELDDWKVTTVRVRVVKNNDVDFFTKRSFTEYERIIRLRADMAHIDVSCLGSLLHEQETKGITITTLYDELQHSPDCCMKLYEFEQELFTIWPTTDPVVAMSFEAFQDNLNRMQDVHQGYFIAKDGAAYIGCSYIMTKETDPYGLVQGLTGVLSGYQHRGIATALKYCTIQYTKQHGFRHIETASLGHNEPMLAVQRKVGFNREEIEFRLEKKFIRG